MNEPLVADRYASVEWIDTPSEIDPTYTENVELIPLKASQAGLGSIYIENNVDMLFEFTPPKTFAIFEPLVGYKTKLKRLFFIKILSSFDPDTAIDVLDDLFDKGFEDNDDQAEAIYEMLQSLKGLNSLLEEILLRILSTIKS